MMLIFLSSRTATVALPSSLLLNDGEPGFKNTVLSLFSNTLICTWPEMNKSAFKACAILSLASSVST